MDHFNRLPGHYRITLDTELTAPAFEEARAALRDAYRPDQGYTVRAVQGKTQWSIVVDKGLAAGFEIDFVPVQAAFGPPRVEVQVRVHSRLAQVWIYLMTGVVYAAFALYWLGRFAGWWAAGGRDTLVTGALLVAVVVVASTSTVGLVSLAVRGSVTPGQLAAVAQAAIAGIERAGGGRRPGAASVAEPGGAADGGGR